MLDEEMPTSYVAKVKRARLYCSLGLVPQAQDFRHKPEGLTAWLSCHHPTRDQPRITRRAYIGRLGTRSLLLIIARNILDFTPTVLCSCITPINLSCLLFAPICEDDE